MNLHISLEAKGSNCMQMTSSFNRFASQLISCYLALHFICPEIVLCCFFKIFKIDFICARIPASCNYHCSPWLSSRIVGRLVNLSDAVTLIKRSGAQFPAMTILRSPGQASRPTLPLCLMVKCNLSSEYG